MVPKETKKYVLGHYGRPPAPIDEEVRRKIAGDEEAIECRPADLLEPMLDEVREKYGEYIRNDEDVLTFALFPDVALRYFRGEGGEEERKNTGGKRYRIRVDGEEFEVEVEEVR
jgi:oxaloacetate decarboxylase alpha subunit